MAVERSDGCKGHRIVKVRYCDHVEFRKYSLNGVAPVVREAVGWLIYEDDDHVILVFDRPGNTEANGKASGLCILKSDILELSEVGEGDRIV